MALPRGLTLPLRTSGTGLQRDRLTSLEATLCILLQQAGVSVYDRATVVPQLAVCEREAQSAGEASDNVAQRQVRGAVGRHVEHHIVGGREDGKLA